MNYKTLDSLEWRVAKGSKYKCNARVRVPQGCGERIFKHERYAYGEQLGPFPHIRMCAVCVAFLELTGSTGQPRQRR